MRPRTLSILGSTGSIGASCLDVARRFPQFFCVAALAGGENVELLAAQIQEFKPGLAVVKTPALAQRLAALVNRPVEILHGREGYVRAAGLAEADTVVSAMVGAAGLEPTHAAVAAGKRVCLANKETLVMAGELIMGLARESGAEILPVDSEHSAIFQALSGQRAEDVKRIILTASGGPFRGRSRAQLAQVTRQQALAHPNWSMGAKITIDSATLMNKGLEVIEARWLFGLPLSKIVVRVHPQSIVHSLVEFIDGSILAQLGAPDMRVPIAYALSFPARLPLDLPGLSLTQAPHLTFEPPDLAAFPALALALAAARAGGTAPLTLNAANEMAVAAFLSGAISFLDIPLVVEKTLAQAPAAPCEGLAEVMALDQEARRLAGRIIEQTAKEAGKP